MTRPAAALAALLALAACGEDEPAPPTWQPPVVDFDRLGVACPAPEVPILVRDPSSDGIECNDPSRTGIDAPYEIPAGDVIPGHHWVGSPGSLSWSRVTDVVVIESAQRLRLTLTDGRSGVFTADHGFLVMAQETAYFWPLHDLRPGDLLGTIHGERWVVADVESAPDGPVVQIIVTEDPADPCYRSGPLTYLTMGLESFVHTSIAAPQRRPPDF